LIDVKVGVLCSGRVDWWLWWVNRWLWWVYWWVWWIYWSGIIDAANVITATWAKAGKYFVSPIGIARASATTFTRSGCTSIVRLNRWFCGVDWWFGWLVSQNLKRQELGFTNPLIISHWCLASNIGFAKGSWSVGSSA